MIFAGFRFGMLLQVAIGPVCLFVFQSGASGGLFAGLAGAAGAALGDAALILASIFGVGAVMERSGRIKRAMRVFGPAVLILFGANAVLSAAGIRLLPGIRLFWAQAAGGVLLKTLLITLSNPFAILFWAGAFTARITQREMNRRDMLQFGFGAVISTVSFLSLIAFVGSATGAFLPPAVIGTLNALVGLALVTFGVVSALKTRKNEETA